MRTVAPVMAYLTRWRLAIARDLLTDGRLTFDAIAPRVGHSSGCAPSNAFRREYGMSPREYLRNLHG